MFMYDHHWKIMSRECYNLPPQTVNRMKEKTTKIQNASEGAACAAEDPLGLLSWGARWHYNWGDWLQSGNLITGAKQLCKYWESYWDYCQDKVDTNPTSNQGSWCSRLTGLTAITFHPPLWWPIFGEFNILHCSTIMFFILQCQIPVDLSCGFVG